MVRIQFGDMKSAEDNFKVVANLRPDLTIGHSNVAIARSERGDYVGAEKSLQRALRIDPAQCSILQNLGVAQEKGGYPERAEKNCIAAIKCDPKVSTPHKLLGTLQARRGAIEEAKANWYRSINILSFEGRSPVSFAMNLEFLGEKRYKALIKQESDSMTEACKGSWFSSARPELVSALHDLRVLENDADWLVSWRTEQVALFGANLKDATYGAVWFSAWQTIASGESKHALNALQGNVVLVLGSGLGEQCVFAVALGAKRLCWL